MAGAGQSNAGRYRFCCHDHQRSSGAAADVACDGLAADTVLRQVRKEAEKSGIDLNSPPKNMVNVTPLHRRLQQDLWKYLGLIR